MIIRKVVAEEILNEEGTREEKRDKVFERLKGEFALTSTEDCENLQKQVNLFSFKMFQRYDLAKRNKSLFFSKNADWLSKNFDFEKKKEKEKGGRPDKPFAESSDRSKRRKTNDMRQTHSGEELLFAAKMKLREEGKLNEANVLKKVENSSTQAEKILTDLKASGSSTGIKPYTEDEALAYFVEADLSKYQYQLTREEAIERNADIYPSYDRILSAKKRCYPDSNSITVSEGEAVVKLQALLDHTTTRLAQVQDEVINTMPDINEFTLISKWGCDGSSGQSQYKQKASSEFSDASIFLTSLVPIQLKPRNKEINKIIWQNPCPASTRYCRPVRFQFKKETEELTQAEASRVEEEIDSLKPTEVVSNGRLIKVFHVLYLTMIDGKVCNVLSDVTSSTQCCNICGASPKEMNDLSKVRQKNPNTDLYCFGLSSLHGWIRFFECILHIAYKLPIRKWQARGEDKEKVAETKLKIQKQFKEEMGLLVDMPKAGGSGSTNDGNTARRFFENPELAASITGVDKDLIFRFSIILKTLASNYPIDVDAFENYTAETARIYVDLYPWYFMPPSVHKVLMHGSQIISSVMVPIGMLSEEAQEARNKNLKSYRRDHTRKTSRSEGNEDLFNRLLVTSDPVITSLRKIKKSKKKSLPSEVVGLLKPYEP